MLQISSVCVKPAKRKSIIFLQESTKAVDFPRYRCLKSHMQAVTHKRTVIMSNKMLLTLGTFQMPLDISRTEFMKETFLVELLRRAQ
jgi:gamma-glutamylcysteine synthetase